MFGFRGSSNNQVTATDEEMTTTTRPPPTPDSANFSIGDIVVLKFRDEPYLGYVLALDNALSSTTAYKIVPLQESAVPGNWIKAGKVTTKTRRECIKLPSCLSDMSITI